MFNKKLIEDAAKGDLKALLKLDKRGLLIGVKESLDDYIKRLKNLQKNIAKMDDDLKKSGKYEVDGETVNNEDRIPTAIFAEVEKKTMDLYHFKIDWVPGFFINPNFSWLFGGCAFYFYPDFFAMFIIRRSFANKRKWLIYSREELISHELCHVAHAGLYSKIFEETFAYQTSNSGFRKLIGGIFRSQYDSFALLGSTFLLLGAQIAKVVKYPNLPIFPFWGIIALLFIFLLGRHCHYQSIFNKAVKNMTMLNPKMALPAIFRCSDKEILKIAKNRDKNNLQQWLNDMTKSSPRWQVIQALLKKK